MSSVEAQFSDPLAVDKAKEDELTRKILWKLDLHVIPVLILLYFLSNLDQTNLSNAGVAGLKSDLHLVGNQFNIAVMVVYISFVLATLPYTLILKTIGANVGIPLMVGLGGLVSLLIAFVHSYGSLIAVRFILGVMEGGVLSGIMLYLSTLYQRHELQSRAGIFMGAGCIINAFGGLLTSAITHMNGIGHLAGWRWIFILEGLFTIVYSVITVFILPADVKSARFFTAEEREFAVARLQKAHAIRAMPTTPDQDDNEKSMDLSSDQDTHSSDQHLVIYDPDERFEWREVQRGFLDVQTWLTAICAMSINAGLFSWAYFFPTILAGLGYSGNRLQLLSSPPYGPATVVAIAASFASDRVQKRGPFILVLLGISIIGYILVICASTNAQRYGASFLILAGGWGSLASGLSILPNNIAGHYKRATACAIQLGVAHIGSVIGAWLYTADQAPRYIRGHTIGLAFAVLGWLCMLGNVLYCLWENRARASGRRQSNIEKYQALWDVGKTRAPIGDRHPEFRYIA